MCGVFGIVRRSGLKESDFGFFTVLGDSLWHRGPDGVGFIHGPSYALGMHRLSIVDVDHGWQPFWTEDESVGVLGNGEIYNADQLRSLLQDRGHLLRTRSDMEVIPHLYEEYGLDFVHRLRGMFALVLLDRSLGMIFLVRDRMGEKPLSFAASEGRFVFASEQSALVRAQVVDLTIDSKALTEYLLHGFMPEPRSILTGIQKVPAGHMVTVDVDSSEFRVIEYWNPMDYLGSEPLSNGRLQLALEQAIEVATVSDVPVGIALSGGLDSSLVAAIAHSADVDLQAFSVGYPTAAQDESIIAGDFARSLGIPFHRIELSSDEIASDFADVCGRRDEPIADIAGPALDSVASAARSLGVPVLLTGLGGDELFWGYEWVRRLATFAEDFLMSGRTGRGSLPSAPPRNRQGLVDWISSWAGMKTHAQLTSFMRSGATQGRVPLPLFEFQYGTQRVHRLLRELQIPNPLPEFSLLDDVDAVAASFITALASSYLRVNGLTQLDRLSMAHSVESRVPFVDHCLVETVMSSLWGSRAYRDPPKMALLKAAEGHLPAELLSRRKRGFTPPVRSWLAKIWAANPAVLQLEALNMLTDLPVTVLRSRVQAPVRPTGQVDQLAFRLLTLELWAARQVDLRTGTRPRPKGEPSVFVTEGGP